MKPGMDLPLLDHAIEEPSAFTPEALISAVRAERGLATLPVPPVCLLEFDGDLTDSLVSSGAAKRWTSWACFHTMMFAIEFEGVPFGIIPRTIGGPFAVLVAEQLAAAGVRLILGLTSAGRVSPSVPVPSFVVATEAIRDEGTSFHYLPPSPRVAAPASVVQAVELSYGPLDCQCPRALCGLQMRPTGKPKDELAQYSEAGILAVEMQSASLFAFSAARNVPVGVVAHVTNAVDHAGEPFHRGSQPENAQLLKALCRAGRRLLESHSSSSPVDMLLRSRKG